MAFNLSALYNDPAYSIKPQLETLGRFAVGIGNERDALDAAQ
jgi:hypothetical protein